MAGCFPGVDGRNIEGFFMSLIISDASMPHTLKSISPITFTEFMSRNAIINLDPLSAYNDLNGFWRKYLKENGVKILECTNNVYPFDNIYENFGGWNNVIDYMFKMLEVEKIRNPYYQMHYLAHLFYEMNEYIKTLPDVSRDAYRTLVANAIAPILYEAFIPTNYFFLPVMNYLDVRFQERINVLVRRVNEFIDRHRATVNNAMYNAKCCEYLKEQAESAMKETVKYKYERGNVWKQHASPFFTRSLMMKTDLSMCEAYPLYEQNGYDCIRLFKIIDKIHDRWNRGKYDDDPDMFIDDMLDVRPKSKQGVTHAQT